MSKSTIPDRPGEFSLDRVEPETRAIIEPVIPIAKEWWDNHRGTRRHAGWAGTIQAAVLVESAGGLQFIAPDVIATHRVRHARHRKCGKSCLARDLFAFGIVNAKGWYAATGWPIRGVLARMVERLTGYRIKKVRAFAAEVERDLRHLPAAVSTPTRRRTAGQKSLVARYSATSATIRALQATAVGPEKSGGADVDDTPLM
jgi:hypothetical protein